MEKLNGSKHLEIIKFKNEKSALKLPIAPEIIALTNPKSKSEGYDTKVDMWSLGVILYILICGFPPFHADDDSALFKVIQHGV